jgi:hypothetical protein
MPLRFVRNAAGLQFDENRDKTLREGTVACGAALARAHELREKSVEVMDAAFAGR